MISRTLVTACITTTSILLPGFGKVMAFLGSSSAFLICIILPLSFYLVLAPGSTEDGTGLLIGCSVVVMVSGIVWSLSPGGQGEIKE